MKGLEITELSDNALNDLIENEAKQIASIKCQLISDDIARKSGEETRGKTWRMLAKRALLKKGVNHQAMLREKSRRTQKQKELNMAVSKSRTDSDSVRFVEAARELLDRDQYLSIWEKASEFSA